MKNFEENRRKTSYCLIWGPTMIPKLQWAFNPSFTLNPVETFANIVGNLHFDLFWPYPRSIMIRKYGNLGPQFTYTWKLHKKTSDNSNSHLFWLLKIGWKKWKPKIKILIAQIFCQWSCAQIAKNHKDWIQNWGSLFDVKKLTGDNDKGRMTQSIG